MTSEEILQRIKEDEENIAQMRFWLATSQLTNTSKIRITRKDIARMYSVLTERKPAEGKHA